MASNQQHERVILYASRSRVEEGTVFPSTEAQLVRLEQDAQLRGQGIVAAFAEEGWSGKSLRGPKLKAALAMLEAGEATVLKITRMNRVVRSAPKLWALVDRLRGWSARIETLEGGWDFDSAKGRFVSTIMAAVDQLAVEEAGELFSLKNRQRVVDKGLYVGSYPYGYRMGERGVLEPDPVEASIIQQLAAWLLETGSVAEVLDRAHNAGYKRRESRTVQRGDKPAARSWAWESIKYMLSNPALLGLVPYKGETYKGQHPPLLEMKQFNEIQEILKRNSGTAGKGDRRNAYPYLLGCRLAYATPRPDGGADYDPYYGYSSTKRNAEGEPYHFYRRASSCRRAGADGARPKGEKLPFSHLAARDIEDYIFEQLKPWVLDEARWSAMQRQVEADAKEAAARVAARQLELEAQLAGIDRRKAETVAWLKREHYEHGGRPRIMDQIEAQLAQLAQEREMPDQLLADCEPLRAWFARLPGECTEARGKYLRLLQSHEKGARRVCQGLLRDLLQEPFGVIIWPDHVEIRVSPGAVLAGEMDRIDKIQREFQVDWAVLDSNQWPPRCQRDALTN